MSGSRKLGSGIRDFIRSLVLIAAAVPVLGIGGCALGESVVDGFYGGISDTVAAVISALLLGGRGA